MPARAIVLPVMCASDKTHLTKLYDDQHTWRQYLMICSIQKDIRHTPKNRTWSHIGLILCPPEGDEHTVEPLHSVVGIVLSALRNLDITCPSLNWNYTDSFERQCHSLLTAWDGDYPEQVMISQV